MRLRLLTVPLLASFVALPFWAAPPTRIAENVHTRYDRDLGWSNVPGRHLPDLYGPGLRLSINAQGFREDADVPARVPQGKHRVLCSGDSFTLGYGVGQEDTWCAQLERLDPGLDAVNMGQGGYGIDQSYLWYLRDGRGLSYDAHLFTFIFADFERMKLKDFFGYGKPSLEVENGRLVARPAAPFDPSKKRLSRLTAFRIWLNGFPFMRRAELWARKNLIVVDDEGTRRVTRAVFASLAAENRARDARLLLVYLPTRYDLEATRLDRLRAFLRKEALEQGIEFLDLTPDFRALDADAVDRFFLSADDVAFAGAAGHYSAAGNRFVAERLHAALRKA